MVLAVVGSATMVLAPAASAAPGNLSFLEQETGPALAGARGVAAVGNNVYVAGQNADAVTTFTRAADGTLTNTGCVKDTGAPVTTCGSSTEGLNSARFIAVPPDGKNVYVTGGEDDAVVIFDRNTSTGALSNPTCVKDTASSATCGGTAPGLDGAEGIAAAGNNSIYVAAQQGGDLGGGGSEGAVVGFDRAGDGSLSGPQCFTLNATASCTTTPNLDHPRELAASPDGKGVYVASASSNVVAAFLRDTGSGDLSAAGSAAGVSLPVGVTVSPDSKHVYAGAVNSDAVRVYSRNTSTSALTAQGCLKDVGSPTSGCTTAEGLDGVEGVKVSPDGANVYAAGVADSAVVSMTRSSSTGALGALGCVKDSPGGGGCGSGNGLGGAEGVAVSPNGANVYVTGFNDGAVVALKGSGSGGGSQFEPPRPKPECINATTLLVTCADPHGAPGVCGPTASILPQCSFPVDLPTVCGPSNSILQACVPPENYVTACGGTGTVLPVCTGTASPILVCGPTGVLPQCSLPPNVTGGTLDPSGGGEIDVKVGCSIADAGGSERRATAAKKPPKCRPIDLAVADYKRVHVAALKQAAPKEADSVISSGLGAPGQASSVYAAQYKHDVAAFIQRADRIVDQAFADAEAGGPFRRATLIFQFVEPAASPAYVGLYQSGFRPQMERAAEQYVDQIGTAVARYREFLDEQRSQKRQQASASGLTASGLVQPLVRKRVKLREGKRKKVKIKLKKKAVKQLTQGVKKSKGFAARLLVTQDAEPYPIVHVVDFGLDSKKGKKGKKGKK